MGKLYVAANMERSARCIKIEEQAAHRPARPGTCFREILTLPEHLLSLTFGHHWRATIAIYNFPEHQDCTMNVQQRFPRTLNFYHD
jgi:hypothetical protein